LPAQPAPTPALKPALRLSAALAWRWGKIALAVRRSFILKSGAAYIRWRWPWPMKKPWQRARLKLVSQGGGLGDELLCTPVFREIRRRNPGCHLTFLSRRPEVFRGNADLSDVELFSRERGTKAIHLRYDVALPPPRPLITLLAECVGLELHDNRLDPPRVDPSVEVRARMEVIASPRVIIQPQASGWTPNKQWPVESWRDLVIRLTEHFEVIEVGSQPLFGGENFGPRFHSLAGTTSVTEFAWVISQATVFVGPLSGGMHCAHAFGVPMVAIFGGYESPEGYDYPWDSCFFTPVECAPCWLATPCPYDRKCLRAIQPEEVFRAITEAMEKRIALP